MSDFNLFISYRIRFWAKWCAHAGWFGFFTILKVEYRLGKWGGLCSQNVTRLFGILSGVHVVYEFVKRGSGRSHRRPGDERGGAFRMDSTSNKSVGAKKGKEKKNRKKAENKD